MRKTLEPWRRRILVMQLGEQINGMLAELEREHGVLIDADLAEKIFFKGMKEIQFYEGFTGEDVDAAYEAWLASPEHLTKLN